MTATEAGRMSNRRLLIILIVLVLVLGAGFALYLYLSRPTPAEPPIPLSHASASYPVTFDPSLAVVTLGQPQATVVVDLYEDFLSPEDATFQRADFPTLERLLAAGRVRVRDHLVGMLSGESVPIGYSRRAANAALALAATAPTRFPDYRASLLAAEPATGTAGWDNVQLTALGVRLGVTDSALGNGISGGTYDQVVDTGTDTDVHTANLWTTNTSGALAFHAPTVVVNGKTVPDWRDPGWLSRLTAG